MYCFGQRTLVVSAKPEFKRTHIYSQLPDPCRDCIRLRIDEKQGKPPPAKRLSEYGANMLISERVIV